MLFSVREFAGTASARSHYFCEVNDPLHNPVYQALLSGDQHLSRGSETVKYFDEDVSPFAGLKEQSAKGFDELFTLLPEGRLILYASPAPMETPGGWQLLHHVPGLQLVDAAGDTLAPLTLLPVALGEQHVPQMLELAGLTRPGPFGAKTILFGHYHGLFEGDRLVAMTGQRLHVHQYTEISAVCTHPDYLGRGYAHALMLHQVALIRAQGKTPFLHVRDDNERAIGLYLRLGFKINGPMNFYFMKRG